MKIEAMTAQAIPQVADLETRCFSAPWSRALFEGELRRQEATYLVAWEGERVLGYGGFFSVLREGYITNVAVHPEARRRGIADALVSALKDAALAQGLSFLTLEARVGNVPAIGLYEKQGFVPVGRRKGYYDQPLEDAVLMTLFLEEEAPG